MCELCTTCSLKNTADTGAVKHIKKYRETASLVQFICRTMIRQDPSSGLSSVGESMFVFDLAFCLSEHTWQSSLCIIATSLWELHWPGHTELLCKPEIDDLNRFERLTSLKPSSNVWRLVCLPALQHWLTHALLVCRITHLPGFHASLSSTSVSTHPEGTLSQDLPWIS